MKLPGRLLILLISGVKGLPDFLTEGVDNARTGWVRDEKIFTRRTFRARNCCGSSNWHAAGNAQPLCAAVAERVTTAQGTRSLPGRRRNGRPSASMSPPASRSGIGTDSTLANPGGTSDTCVLVDKAVPTMAGVAEAAIYAVSWDACGRSIWLTVGTPPEKSPGGGKPCALNLYNGVIYTATAQGCGGLTNAFLRSTSPRGVRAPSFRPAVASGAVVALRSLPTHRLSVRRCNSTRSIVVLATHRRREDR
jgi:hypothetical protein